MKNRILFFALACLLAFISFKTEASVSEMKGGIIAVVIAKTGQPVLLFETPSKYLTGSKQTVTANVKIFDKQTSQLVFSTSTLNTEIQLPSLQGDYWITIEILNYKEQLLVSF